MYRDAPLLCLVLQTIFRSLLQVRQRLGEMAKEASDAARSEWQHRLEAAVAGAQEAAQARFGEAAASNAQRALEISELSVQLRQALEEETEQRQTAEVRAITAERNAKELEQALTLREKELSVRGEAIRREAAANNAVGVSTLFRCQRELHTSILLEINKACMHSFLLSLLSNAK